MHKSTRRTSSIRLRFYMVIACILLGGPGCAVSNLQDDSPATNYFENNDYIPDAFPAELVTREFSIPLDDHQLVVVVPSGAETHAADWRRSLNERVGIDVSFIPAEEISRQELADSHLIILGNINDNPRLYELYKQRHAFTDAYFPGEDGFIIHPSKSIWNRENNALVIGASRTRDLDRAFYVFLDQLSTTDVNIGPLRILETDLAFPEAPETVQPILDRALANAYTSMAPYLTIANWGFSYHLSGDEKWAEHFRDAFYMMRDRARNTDRWISESWTNVYFHHWRLMFVWDRIDDDPFFTDEDRQVIEEVLWGFTTFIRWLPNLDPEQAPPGEMRQNHTTFLALSLYFAHQYYTQKYEFQELDSMMDKVHRAFEDGQANSFIPNDDAGGYLKYGSLHTLTYLLAEDDMSYIESGRLAQATDLLAAVFDNRGQQVSFGDVGSYNHRGPGSTRDAELKFFSMSARYYDQPQYQWFYQWLGGGNPDEVKLVGDRQTDPDHSRSGAEQTGQKSFALRSLYSGDYVTPMSAEFPADFTGVQVIHLDEATRKWFGRRAAWWGNEHIPRKENQYFHKIAMRRNFDANDEYLLLGGLSALSHGHHDGNTILRLTWKDRIWLFDLDYIKFNTKYHNGVTVVRDGIQQDPPPVTRFDFSVHGAGFGLSRSTAQNYSGADWERTILWGKGKWFFILDRLQALESGDYRLTGRWRTRGDDVSLEGNKLRAVQGGKSFYIKSADMTPRRLEFEPDGYRANWGRYPWGEGGLDILVSRRDTSLGRGETVDFVNLLSASDDLEDPGYDLLKVAEDQYLVTGPDAPLFVGMDPAFLESYNLSTDAGMFMIDSDMLYLIDVGRLWHQGASLHASSLPPHLIVNLASGSIRDFQGNAIRPPDASMAESLRQAASLSERSLKLAYKVHPASGSSVLEDFGLESVDRIDLDGSVTARIDTGEGLVMGDINGKILHFREDFSYDVIGTPAGIEITSVATGDLNGDGQRELIAGDRDGNLYAYSDEGALLWHHKLAPFFGANATVNDITVGVIDDSGQPVVLAGNAGWKVTAVEPHGDIRWESFIFYHAVTRVEVLDTGRNKRYVVAGNNYHTPVNVIDPETGRVIYYTWEEMGSEFIATTENFGIHLTDMLFFDADGDGKRDIVFGTLSNHVYAVKAADGSKIWEVNAGDEVTVLAQFNEPNTGSIRLLVGNSAGELSLLDRDGKRLHRAQLGHRIQDLRVFPPEQGRVDIAVATEGGDLMILDDELLVRAAHRFDQPLQGLFLAGRNDRIHQLLAVGVNSVYRIHYEPFHLRRSWHY